MLDSSNEPGRLSDAVAYGEQPDAAVECDAFPGFSPPNGQATGVDLRSLPPGTELIVDTRNSRYRFVLLDGTRRNALVQGGRHFREETKVRVEGSTLGGSLIKIGWIGMGLLLEVSIGRTRLVTSPVRSIRVEPSPRPSVQ